jgi:chemotaxis protein methyltransferase CheR
LIPNPKPGDPSIPASGLAPSGPVLGAREFKRIAALLHAETGIHLPDAKASLVYSRLAKRLRALGLKSFRDYCALVLSEEGVDERQRMIAALTTNVTRFFREPHHFEHLKETVLPPLLAAAARGGRVRLWSAGCSSGQEPYSIALTVLSLRPEAAALDVKILATDIDTDMVATGRAGVYGAEALAPVPPAMRKRWFTPLDGEGGKARDGRAKDGKASGEKAWEVGEELRQLVAFRELNLFESWPMKGPFQAIFCRNVVIYFEERGQSQIWNRFAGLLASEGLLYVGHSERLTGPAAAAFRSEATTTYRLLGEARQ